MAYTAPDRRAVYRDYRDGPWDEDALPGPLPQLQTGVRITARTYCTCGHSGATHARQTLTTGHGPTRDGRGWTEYTQTEPLRFKGTCRAGQWDNRCPCTWFVEDLDKSPREEEPDDRQPFNSNDIDINEILKEIRGQS